VVIEDKEVVNSKMDGRPWEAGKFSLSLRLSLWAEHLGLRPGEVWPLCHYVLPYFLFAAVRW